MISIHWTSNPGSRSTKETGVIQCVDGREPQIHELWCLDLYNTTHEVHPTGCVEVIYGTVGDFVTNYLAENECRIHIIGQLSVNDSVYFLVVPTQAWGRGLTFLRNLQAPDKTTGWGSDNYFIHAWGGIMLNANIITNFAWGASIDASPANSPWSPINPRAA